MSTPAPVITIFVRHSADCKYAGDEFCKRCDCRKHLRWTQGGRQFRRKAGTRSWAEAERLKRGLEDQLSGKASNGEPDTAKSLTDAIEIFLQDKRNQGITAKVIGKYSRELARFRDFCEGTSLFTVQGISRELLTQFCATWPEQYPSTYTRAKVRERLRSFLRYCYEAEYIPRIPALPKIKIEEPPTLPLSEKELQYNSL